jgi:uncharacterized protein YggE
LIPSIQETNMSRSILLPLVLAIGTALGTATPMTANAQTTASAPAVASDSTLLSVSASAEASRVPDVASLSTKVVAAIKAAGIAERDIQTTGINIHPQYRYAENQPPTITGYQASNTVNIKVRDVAKVGEVLDALVASGANQVNGPSFEIDQPEAVYDEARQEALKQARARAEMYARSLGMKVRRIVSISEGGGFQPPVPMMKTMAMDARMESAPVAPGETTLSANLDVVFELGN